ncbi:MAG: hypothetical protein ACTSWN_08565, partial [Promethearchaeota archaeon]
MPQKCPICEKEYKKITKAHLATKLHRENLRKKGISPEDDPTLALFKETKKSEKKAEVVKEKTAEVIDETAVKASKVEIEEKPEASSSEAVAVSDTSAGVAGVKDEADVSKDGGVTLTAEKKDVEIQAPASKREIKSDKKMEKKAKTGEIAAGKRKCMKKDKKSKAKKPSTVARSPQHKKLGLARVLPFTTPDEKKETLKYLTLSIFTIGVAIGIAFIIGQLTHGALETNASNCGHMYGILTSTVAFFIFANHLQKKKDTSY